MESLVRKTTNGYMIDRFLRKLEVSFYLLLIYIYFRSNCNFNEILFCRIV